MDGTFSHLSPAVESVLGIEPAERVGRSFPTLLTPATSAAAVGVLESAVAGETVRFLHLELQAAGGSLTHEAGDGGSTSCLAVPRVDRD